MCHSVGCATAWGGVSGFCDWPSSTPEPSLGAASGGAVLVARSGQIGTRSGEPVDMSGDRRGVAARPGHAFRAMTAPDWQADRAPRAGVHRPRRGRQDNRVEACSRPPRPSASRVGRGGHAVLPPMSGVRPGAVQPPPGDRGLPGRLSLLGAGVGLCPRAGRPRSARCRSRPRGGTHLSAERGSPHVSAGHRLSLQHHHEKDESCYVLAGSLTLFQGDSADELYETRVTAGDVWRNLPGVVHTIQAIEDSDVLEVSTAHLEDAVRLVDDYGREGASAP